MPTKQELIEIATTVRENTISETYGKCFPASKTLRKQLAKHTTVSKDEIEIEEVRMGEYGTLRHYVVAYPANVIEDVDAYGRVLIDITLDQYCDENLESGKVETSLGPRHTIPNINFYETKEQAPYS